MAGGVLSTKLQKMLVPLIGAVGLFVILGVALYFVTKNDSSTTETGTDLISSFEECAAAGYPVMESYPRQCRVPGGLLFSEVVTEDAATERSVRTVTDDCSEDESEFADESFGAAFCYPSAWGEAITEDAKLSAEDTGHREVIRFTLNDKFVVGGSSDDWTTEVGRGGSCLEPNNQLVEMSSYDTSWHDIIGEGDAIEFAARSLEVSAGGYDSTETVSTIVENGVCAQGHKIIDGSRYRILYAGYYEEFQEGAVVATPAQHIANPLVLFTTTERAEFDGVLASARAY